MWLGLATAGLQGPSKGRVPSMSLLGDTARGVPQVCGTEGHQGKVHTPCNWLIAPSHGWLWPLGFRGDIFWGLLVSGWVGVGTRGCHDVGPRPGG